MDEDDVRDALATVDEVYGETDVVVYVRLLDVEDDVRSALLARPDVRGVLVVSQAEARDEYACLAAADPALPALTDETAAALPMSFRVDVGTDRAVVEKEALSLEALPGVYRVVSRPTEDEIRQGLAAGQKVAPDSPHC